MVANEELTANIAAFMKPYIENGGIWLWEDPLVKVAKYVFKVPDRAHGNPRLAIVAGKFHGSLVGTGSDKWNKIILAVGQQIRARENPDKNDYHKSHYASHTNLSRLCRLVAELLMVELRELKRTKGDSPGDRPL